MEHYQVRSYLAQIESNIDRLLLPLSGPDCVIPAEHRKALYSDILRAIDDLYDRSVIDVLDYDQLSDRALQAYIHGGLLEAP